MKSLLVVVELAAYELAAYDLHTHTQLHKYIVTNK